MLGEAVALVIVALAQVSTPLLAFVIGTIAFIISKSKLFEKPRNKITHPFFKKLVNCPYCLSFWLAGIWIFLYFFKIFVMFAILLFLLGGLGGIVGIVLTWLCKKAGL